ncbi:putative Zn-binding protein involved in type VI secretion [Paraburkholderia sp. GV068]|jgi:uncharacterized Zn-binding protein involved in type VI secretion|uniref:PAAR domain-containing protein n=1 Tax=unclassified Paraburkholderia TaxID=2615204 RepID=UPI000D2F8733|nr:MULTISPECIES: PAAR domain-containing protein [unclassified Paraburkholderia]PTQ91435.1 putative Zn-binding protein involved in type VI secretion [Paraburkholderia sp. GV072]PUA93645.1 putative Zn-binding protein involved in type VI secretion [Paraburkholderia sp. GV068]
MSRYDITKGDTTTVGGTVQGGDSTDMLNGREQAYENDPVWCPVCKTVGHIQCQGSRVPTTGPDGREVALSDDLCICACEPSPRLVASQSVSSSDA